MNDIIVICKGGFSKEVVEYLAEIYPPGHPAYRLKEVRNLYPSDELRIGDKDVFVVANGDPTAKRHISERISNAGGKFLSIIHPRAHVSPSARIGSGAIIAPFCFVGPDAVLDSHVTLNLQSAVGHDSRVGAFTVLSPYAFIAGNGTAGDGAFFGAHAFLAPSRSVGENSKISAGAVCLRDVPPNSLAMGNPAAAREMFRTREAISDQTSGPTRGGTDTRRTNPS